MRWLVPLIALFASSASGLEVRELSIKYKAFHARSRLLEIPGFQAKEGLTLTMNIDLLGPFYWDNRIITLTDSGQYRYIAWNFFFGFRVLPDFYAEYEHMSGHLLDTDQSRYPNGRFPVQDSLGFRWYFIGGPTRLRSVFRPLE